MQSQRPLVTEPIGVEPEQLPRPIDWQQLFGNANPVEIEIGCGKGTFITTQALARPEVNFFGIEWARWFWRYTCDRLRRHDVKNARAIRADAGYFLDEFVPDASVSVLHIYFPDPWPKARHHKRRLVQEKFMPKVKRILTPGGRVQVVTDHVGYWEEAIQPALRTSGLTILDYAPPVTAREGETVGTNFERKFIAEGRPFYSIVGRKDQA